VSTVALGFLGLIAAGALATACGGDDGDTRRASPNDGAVLYAENCASCHGGDLRGTDTGPSHLSVVYEPGHHPDDAFRSAIADGVRAHHWGFGDMPPVPGLSTAEVDAIIEYVRDVQQDQGYEPYPPA
jgi:mono/diheme cytochrome c family protein